MRLTLRALRFYLQFTLFFEMFSVVGGCDVENVAHFQKPGVNTAVYKILNFVDVLVGGDNGQALFGIPCVDEVVEHFEFPFGVALYAEVVDDKIGNV